MDKDFDSESNFEERLVEDEERNDSRYYTTQLLLFIQNLGTKQKIEELEVYVKGENAVHSLKNLCNQCRRDIPNKPLARIYLAKYRVLQDHLINLLGCYAQDQVLTFYIVILLEQLTNIDQSGLRIQSQYNAQMLEILQDYKLSLMKPLVFSTLVNHFADCTSTQPENRTKVHNQMIELIVLLFRNLLQIPDQEETKVGIETKNQIKRNLQRNFIQDMVKQSVLSGFVYISQEFKSTAMQRLSLPLMEIFYYVFTPFHPEWLLRNEEEESEANFKEQQKFRLQKQQQFSKIPTRHSRFAGLFFKKRELSKSGQVSSQPFHEHQVNKLANQRQKPQIRALISKQKTIFCKPLTMDFYDIETDKNFKEELRISAVDFLIHCFNKLIDQAYIDMNKEIVDTDDKVHYFVLIAYFFKFIRHYCKRTKQINAEELSSEYVAIQAGLQLTQFNFIYSNLIHESTQMKKKNFNYRNFFAVINILLEFLLIVRDLSLSLQQIDRRNSQILLQSIATQDIAKAINIGYGYCQQGLFNDQLLISLIKLTALYYDLLEIYSQGKSWNIRTNKLLKKKIKKQQNKNQKNNKQKENELEQEDRDFIEQDNQNQGEDNDNQQEEQNSNDDDDDDDDNSETDEDQPIYKERKCNFVSEFAIVVDYKVLEKYFYLIKDDKLLSNPSSLNIAIYKYFKRIIDTLKADWIFFQLDFLYVINSILQNRQVTYRSEFTNIIQLFRRITISFIQLFKVNRLMSVEILFRFPNVQTKESILKNYVDVIAEPNDDTYYGQQQQIVTKVTWTQKEDKILIENYEKYKNSESPEEQLSLLLSQFGFSIKSPHEIKKRIKKFRLEEGNEKAIEKYQQLYEMISMKKVEIMAKSIKSLLNDIGEENILHQFENLFSTLKSFIDFRGEECIEMPIPPIDKSQFEFFEKASVQAILLGLDLKPPSIGEIYWRLQTHTSYKEIDEMKKQLLQYIEKGKLVGDDEALQEYQPLVIQSQKKTQQSEQKNNFQEEIQDEGENYYDKNQFSVNKIDKKEQKKESSKKKKLLKQDEISSDELEKINQKYEKELINQQQINDDKEYDDIFD